MPPNIDWDVITSVAESGEPNDEEVLERVAELLQDARDQDFSGDSPKLQLLFKSALKVLDYREMAMEDILREQTEQLDEKDADIEALKRDLDEEKKFAGRTGDTDFYRVEHRKLVESTEMYREQLADLKRELEEVTSERDTFEKELEGGRKQLKNLKSENQEMRYNLREYREIMENQQQQKISAQGQTDSETREKIIEKNKQISELLTQITSLEEVNRDLSSGNRRLKTEMENAQDEMERMVEEYDKMRKIIGTSDRFTDDLHRQNEQLKMQLSDLREQVRSKTEDEDQIAESVNRKVEEWSKLLDERDRSISEKSKLINILQEKITAANLDQDRIKVEQLTKKLEGKEAHLKELESALNQAIADLEEQTALVQDLRKNKDTNHETIAYKSQIRNLKAEVTKLEENSRELERQRSTAEREAEENDQKLTVALKRVALLESGVYGLTEAVAEIKECKNQKLMCEKEIVELTRHANLLEEKLNDLLEENEEFRERLGVDPRDLQDIPIRNSRALRQQQYRAENQVLMKEIERLEEERIDFKRQIRSQAQSHTQRAMNDGMNSDDLDLVDQFIEDIKKKRRQGLTPKLPSSHSSVEASSERKMTRTMDEIDRESSDFERRLRDAQVENLKLQKESREIALENKQLRAAMKDILQAMKQTTQQGVLKIPSLENLIQSMESKRNIGVESTTHSRAQLEQMTGRNDELRNELRHLRAEHAAVTNEKSELLKQVGYLQSEVDAIAQSSVSRLSSVPRHISAQSKIDGNSNDVITGLNEQLIQTLEELAKKDSMISDLKQSLESSKRKLNAIRHQTHLLYKDHSERETKFENERKSMEDERNKWREKDERDSVKLDEYQRLLDALKSDPEGMKRKLAETSRKVSLLRANEKSLIRRNKALEVTEGILTEDRNKLRNESFLVEKEVSERIGYLERHKEMSVFKLASLQNALEGTVPESELKMSNRKFDDLTSKYRDLLQKENQFVVDNVKFAGLQEELKIASESLLATKQDLTIEKEKRHHLEESFEKLGNKELLLSDVEVSSAIQKV